MGQKVTICLQMLVSVVGVGLSCVWIWQRNPTSAVEIKSTSTMTERPEAFRTGAATNTDGLVINSSEPVRQVQPSQLPANQWQGSSFPVENFQTYTSAFGLRASPDGGYSQEFHYGLDMAAPEGSYIRNWWAGTVKEVSDDTSCGTSVVMQSGDWTATYCHMQGSTESDKQGRYNLDREGGLQIRQGQALPAGARIGRVGMTGRTTGPHLHWTLKYAGNYVDPGYVLRAMYQTQQAQKAE